MSKSLTTVVATGCLMLSACGLGGGTEPHCCETLDGTWMGSEGDLTIRLVVGRDLRCIEQYGYCEDSGTGSYKRAGTDSASFVLSGLYDFSVGSSANIDMSDPVTNKTTTFYGLFDT